MSAQSPHFRPPTIRKFPTWPPTCHVICRSIAPDWKVVEGPTTHRKMQAFPSIAHPGSWSTARRQEDTLYIKVVPELNGLGPQMAGMLNLWLARNLNTPVGDLPGSCSSVACVRFNYDNTPSQAWTDCIE